MYASARACIGLVVGIVFFWSLPAHGQNSLRTIPQPTSEMAPAGVEVIELELGEQRVLSSEGVQSYSEGTKGIVDVRLTKDAAQFIIVALRPGTTTLLFLMTDGSERHYRIEVTDPNAKPKAEELGSVEARENIRLDFYFVQVSKSYGHQIGIGWPASVAPTFNARYDVENNTLESATAVIANQALPRLDMAQVSGWAKVMRQAAVIAANGEKASFAGGGEVNVPVISAMSSGIQKIPFGSIIEVEPRYDSETGRVELRLHADVSELESDRGTGVPGRVTATLDTVVNLELGQSLVLGGLTAKSERRSMAGLPLLSQIPVFGLFFGSHAQAEEESENVVFIVPSVVDAVSMQDRERLDDALKKYREYSGDLEEVDFVPPARVPQAPKARREGASAR